MTVHKKPTVTTLLRVMYPTGYTVTLVPVTHSLLGIAWKDKRLIRALWIIYHPEDVNVYEHHHVSLHYDEVKCSDEFAPCKVENFDSSVEALSNTYPELLPMATISSTSVSDSTARACDEHESH
jgi:hypothetical protein